ncbi:hypothetical protein OESDEN_25449, partial [Oesophagostomum dentatum]
GDIPNYFPNSFNGHVTCPKSAESRFTVSGDVARHEQPDDCFEQPRIFYRKVLNEQERTRMIENIFSTMKDCLPRIQDRAIQNFGKVDADFGNRLRKMIDNYNSQKQVRAHI